MGWSGTRPWDVRVGNGRVSLIDDVYGDPRSSWETEHSSINEFETNFRSGKADLWLLASARRCLVRKEAPFTDSGFDLGDAGAVARDPRRRSFVDLRSAALGGRTAQTSVVSPGSRRHGRAWRKSDEMWTDAAYQE